MMTSDAEQGSMKLWDLLEDSRLRLKVRACRHGLDRPIRWVHTAEIADPSPYLQGGELILTDGCWRSSEQDSAKFVAALARSGVHGVAFGLPEGPCTTPPDLIDACENANIVLLEVPNDVPFMWISEAFVSHLANIREAELRRTIQRSESMVASVKSGEGIAGVLHLLEQEYPLAPWLLSASGRILAVTNDAPDGAELAAALRASKTIGRLPRSADGGNDRALSIFPLMALDDPDRHDAFLVCRAELGDIDSKQRSAVDQGLAYLAIELARLDAERSVRAGFSRELVELIDAGQSRIVESKARFQTLGLDFSRSLAVLSISHTCADTHARLRLSDVVEAYCTAQGVTTVSAVLAEEVVAIMNWPTSHEDLCALAEGLQKSLRSAYPGNADAIGVGPTIHAEAVRQSLLAARHARLCATREPHRPSVASYREIGSFRLLMALQDNDAREAFALSVLGPVLHYDESHQISLKDTLATFLAHGCNWTATARELYVHVNTLRNRIGRIEALTGRSLSNVEGVVDFYLALDALEWVHQQKRVPDEG